MAEAQGLALLFFGFCTFFIALLIWLKRRDHVGKRYFIFSLFVSCWAITEAIQLGWDLSYEAALLSARILNALAVFIPVTWYHFILIFTDGVVVQRKVLVFLYGLSILIDCFAFTPWFVPRVAPILGFPWFTRTGPIYHLLTLMFFTVVPWGFIKLCLKIRSSSRIERTQLLGFFFATLAGFLGGSLTFLPAYEIGFPQYGLFLMPIYPFVMAYFMMRQNLFDLEEIARAAQRDKLAAIGTLVTSINHEIKNPFYVIRGLAESHLENLNQGVYPSKDEALKKTSEILSKTIDQTQRAMDIMKRFALFAKQRTGEVQFEDLNLAEALENILPLIRHELELDKIELVKEISEDLPLIHADRRHIEEILFNLIVNACQAMKEGGQLTIQAEQRNNLLSIIVKDTGPGIPSEQLSKIFEPFYTTKSSGTGLGLYVTKQLVERNKGKITVESHPGQGTTFTLKFKQ